MYKLDLNDVSRVITINRNNKDNTSVVIFDQFLTTPGNFYMRTFTHLIRDGKKCKSSCLCKRCGANMIDNSDLAGKYFVYNVEDGIREYQSTVSEDELYKCGDSVLVQPDITECTVQSGVVAYKATEMELCPECAIYLTDTTCPLCSIDMLQDMISWCSDNGYTVIFIVPKDDVEVVIVSDDEIYVKHLD